ncbi:proline-, glutamic acid- and leucine-rich protein 1-like [Cervus elaphus]|uniref:proline-, glutamic acid- and leucine-rich protein 1-like n=1 Tax=Cervus elaphus TaxID=9860 RepID=UPI001CC2BA19|nr:proline-, glutamic acid- and leucine-rich protein 1-like [Cervus elaphus]
MSATEEHDWIPDGLARAGGGAGCDPTPLGVLAPTWEGTDGVEEALLPSLRVSGALCRGHGGPQATMEEVWDIEPLEEGMEGGLEEMEENEDEDEADFELEGVEEEHLLEEVEEEEETVEDDESEQEVAAMVAGHGDPLEQFGPVFWGLVHSLLRSLSYDDHVLVWPPDPRLMVRCSSQPPSGPGEGPAPPQEQEDLGKGGKASQVPVPKEASDYQYEESDEEVQEAEGEEENSNEKPEEGPEKDLDPAEDSPGEPSCQV